MAKDNNNINTDDLTGATPSSSVKATPASSSTTTEGENGPNTVEAQSTSPSLPPATSSAEVPRREENPFSFKHFLKWDGNHAANGASSGGTGTVPSSSINHSRSASSINGHGSSSLADGAGTGCSNGTNGTFDVKMSGIVSGPNGTHMGSNLTAVTTATTSTGSPSKSATTSSLNVVSSTTGARPKIPQFQSVNTLSSESKMKRSPRFPSFDSQSSLSDFADDRFGPIYQSRSNGSFNSDYPAGGSTGNSGMREDANGIEQLGEQVELLRGYVQRSYSNYDLDSPGSSAVGADRRNDLEAHNEPSSRGLVGATEFSAVLPDFVQDHLVMEQWYNTLPKGAGSGSSGSADFEDVLDLTGVANVSAGSGGGGAPLSSCNDIPFDLTASSTTSSSRANRDQNAAGAGHRHSLGVRLDFPSRGGANPAGPELEFDLPPRSPTASSSELPPDLTEGNAGGVGEPAGPGGQGGSIYFSGTPGRVTVYSGTTADKIHRLPDFLSDGPIHSSGRLADVTHDTPHASETAAAAAAASDRRQRIQQRQREAQYQNRLGAELMENERLRRELEASRRTVSEQSRRIRELERDLETMVTLARPGGSMPRDGGNGTTQSNASSFLQAKTRAATAEAEMKQLRQKLSSMTVEMEALQRENETLKVEACGGAIGGSTGAGASARVRQDDGDRGSRPKREQSSAFLRAQTVALRQAASTAESNLRQLLSGVENLRTMANQIEAFRNTQDEVKPEANSPPLEDYLHDSDISSNEGDDDDDADVPFGPAL
ncbi:autotransporter adhesin BpaC [Anopheles marshallii]|uniref:autotransporter adhesin BpaC n=1 Tax=Anopheles marshallii TaxID=1521116 RepID=UPI00237BB461|nr:autotransporter adhesin BpaC [Anopheles marshallii]